MPTLAQMRQYVYDAYPGTRWQERVRKMSDSQIWATYNRLMAKKGK